MRCAVLLFASVFGLGPPSLAQAPPAFTVTLRCPERAAPGRVRCDVDATPPAGSTFGWADLIVLPGSIPPLRGRSSPADGEVQPARASFAFALLAKDRGPQKVKIAVRAVVCAPAGCHAERVEREAAVVVE